MLEKLRLLSVYIYISPMMLFLTKKYVAQCDNYLNNALRERRTNLCLLNVNIYN